MRSLLISIIKFYQIVAPQSIRGRCRFEPTCSRYAILSLQKYSLIKALRLIINRFHRCRPPNGGEDYP